jgi:hypothetical protein
MPITVRDLRAAEERRRDVEATAHAAASVIRAHHRHIAQQFAAIAGTQRLAQQIAAIAGTQRLAQQMAAALLAPKLREFHRQVELVAEQLGSPVQPVDGDLRESQALARTPSVDWLLLSQLTIRAMILAFFLALVVAVWEEQADTAPAQVLIEILGVLFLWQQIDEAVWKKLS